MQFVSAWSTQHFMDYVPKKIVQTDPEGIVDYFPVQSCLWTVGQHGAGNVLV